MMQGLNMAGRSRSEHRSFAAVSSGRARRGQPKPLEKGLS
jgi:hypothetical protein